MTIFDNESFTLKEFCNTVKKINSDELNNIVDLYITFSSGNNYRILFGQFKNIYGLFFYSELLKKNIYFREILQTLDPEFNKLIVRIKTNPVNYDIVITWDEFEKKIKGITKDDIKKMIENK